MAKTIKFKINGEEFSISNNEVSSDLTLLQFIRTKAELRGTKYNCKEGGCGACTVNVVKTTGGQVQAINSCLVTVASCHGWEVTTIEKLGNKLDGYNKLQTTLAKYNGTQCGYCTPAWVMTMNSLLENQPEVTMAEVEEYFSGNICRCTGYRPILDAFKSFAKDSPKFKLADIEDLKICKKTGESCRKESCDDFDDWCMVSPNGLTSNENIRIEFKDGKVWYQVTTEDDIRHVLRSVDLDNYMLVAGNTAKGVYLISEYPDVMIDISSVATLKGSSVGQNLTIGAGNTLAETIKILKERAIEEDFEYLEKMREHLTLVANTGVRNLATLGGNLMIKRNNKEFPSDIFLLIETVGGMVTIMDQNGISQEYYLRDFLNVNMRGKIILNVILPPYNEDHHLVTYKIMPRSLNAIARVNAGFLYELTAGYVISATIVYGGISASFTHATKTESYLKGKSLFTNETLQGALKILNEELVVDDPTEYVKSGKKKIALGLFYKSLLSLCPENSMNPKYVSGATMLRDTRGVSEGQQRFSTDPSLYPLNQPIPKVEALIQCSGEAPYMDDIPSLPHEVFASFVLSTVGAGTIASIDATKALALDGVLAFYSARDIPGANYYTSPVIPTNIAYEEVLCDGTVKYNGQPIGIIVATSENVANRAAGMVFVVYSNTTTPVISTRAAAEDANRSTLSVTVEATNKGTDVATVINGSANLHEQYHFTMEKQSCVTIPTDEGIEVMSSTQWIDHAQYAVASALGIDENRIDMKVRRVGGSFGAKISRSSQIAVACSLVATKLNRPCRMVLPLTTNTKAIGKRLACAIDFEVGVNSSGVIQYVNLTMHEDNGYIVNEQYFSFGVNLLGNCYDKTKWSLTGYDVVTDKPSGTWFRGPGSFDMIAACETPLEQISYALSLDPIQVRIVNLSNAADDENNSNAVLIYNLMAKSEYERRKAEVTDYNSANRWKKRGLGFSSMKFYMGTNISYPCTVGINHGDGTVVVCHGGVEIGQGINTKAVQICAYTLGIPMDKIKVKATNNIVNINSFATAASFTSEYICLGIIKCCEILKDRLAQFGNLEWGELITTAFTNNVSLFAAYMVTPPDASEYYIFGSCLTEVEMDIITGETQILRVDLIEDVGQSLSPLVDLGQIEGSFVQGLGYWLMEEVEYDTSGRLLNDRSLNYHVPLAKDIPKDFRVYFRENAYNPSGVLGSKATGEPACCMAISIPFGMRRALAASRADSKLDSKTWLAIDNPYTVEKMVNAASVDITEFVFT